METRTVTEEKGGDKPRVAPDVDQLHESQNVAVRIRRQLNFSLLGLSGLAVILGSLVAYHANVIIAVHERDGSLNIKDGVITAACDALALGLEASVGRYGPAVQLGATVGAILGQVIGHFSLRALAPITVASVVAVGVTRYHGSEYVALKLTEENLHLVVWDYAVYVLLGLAAGSGG